MSTAQELTLLLLRLPATGPATYWRLMDEFSSLEALFKAPIDQIAHILKPEALELLIDYRAKGESSAIMHQMRMDLEWLGKHNVSLVDAQSEFYPKMLKSIHRAPPILYVWGDPSVLSLPQIAIIGSRNPSAGGKSNALRFAQELASSGLTITSGLALGIDTAAHQGALVGCGKTIAVLGTGIDQMYPRRNKVLANEIVDSGGAVVTEFPLGVGPLAANFPQRNRIISGLSSGVLVVEAAVKSGSLITARYALQQNREVFAIPGSIHNPLSKGGHALIKDGAKLVETAQDIVDELQGYLAMKWGELKSKPQQLSLLDAHSVALSDDERVILEQLGYDPVSFDILLQRVAVEASELMAILMSMELKGSIEKDGVGYVRVTC